MNEIIEKTALELALKFEDESVIPNRFKMKNSNRINDPKNESLIEKNFTNLVLGWQKTIKSVLLNIDDQGLAWRFIKNTPQLSPDIKNVTLNSDFLSFTDFLIKRRDKDQCSDIELGNLCTLYSTFQRKIENTDKSKKI